jgi:hypothetical protein
VNGNLCVLHSLIGTTGMGPSTGFYVGSSSKLLLVMMVQKPLGQSWAYLEPGDLQEPALGLSAGGFLGSELRKFWGAPGLALGWAMVVLACVAVERRGQL